MFGSIKIDYEQLNEPELCRYRAYHCGQCQELKKQFGRKGQMLLNHDMTFLILLLTGLYGPEDRTMDYVCAMHPTKKREVRWNEATRYVADMNVLFFSKNYGGGLAEPHAHAKKALSGIFQKDCERICEKYPRQEQAVTEYLRRLTEARQREEQNVDAVAGLTGEMLGELFAWKDDEWADELRCMGFYIGKFLYLMESYVDVHQDEKRGAYNVLCAMEQDSGQDFETFCRLMLTSMVTECVKCFDRLPIRENEELCRNILCSGIWTRYDRLTTKKQPRRKRRHHE